MAEKAQEAHQEPTRDAPREALEHWIAAAMESSEVLAEGVTKVDSRMVLGVEADRFQRLETKLLGSLNITPL